MKHRAWIMPLKQGENYYCFCPRCGWTSPYLEDMSEAQRLATEHDWSSL